MTTAYKIPFASSKPQRMEIDLAGTSYVLKTYWCVSSNCWILDVYDINENPLVRGIALVTGTDLFGQFDYLGLGGMLLVWSSDGPWDAVPTFRSLGSTSQVYFVPIKGS